MAGKEQGQVAPEGKFLIRLTQAEMIAGAGVLLVPGLGTLGAVLLIKGAAEYAIIQLAKKEGAKQEKGA